MDVQAWLGCIIGNDYLTYLLFYPASVTFFAQIERSASCLSVKIPPPTLLQLPVFGCKRLHASTNAKSVCAAFCLVWEKCIKNKRKPKFYKQH